MSENKNIPNLDQYKDAMDSVQFSADFEQRTLDKLQQEFGFEKQRKKKPIRRIAALSSCAAALLIGFVALRAIPLPTTPILNKDMAADIPESTNTPIASEYNRETVEMAADFAMPMAQSAATSSDTSAMEAGESLALEAEMETAPYEPPAILPNGNTAEFSHIRERGFASTLLEPLSTFAADVDTASYAIVRGMLRDSIMPAPDMVRTEEFINYFTYDYPAPKSGEPFSVTTEVSDCPWNPDNKLMLVGLQAEKVDVRELPPSNLVFLIDVSGSMDEPDRLPLAQRAFRMLIDQLRPEDVVSIVTYAGDDAVILRGASGEDRGAIHEAIDSLFAGGSTNGADGIDTAYALAQEYFIDGGNNRVILATDGDLNVGTTSEGELVRLIEEKREGGVFLSVMGFGRDNLKDNKLEALADKGNGNYGYIDSALEAKKMLVEELGATFFTVAKDVKLQVEFNPSVVSEYRLIGYENRALSANDFANDAVDGGEIGAGHSVTALYELKLLSGDVEGGELKYQSPTLTQSNDFATVNVRAKAPDGDESKLYSHIVSTEKLVQSPSDNLQFAAAVAEVCMVLRESEFAHTASFTHAAALLSDIKGIQNDAHKDEFAYIVRQLARNEHR